MTRLGRGNQTMTAFRTPFGHTHSRQAGARRWATLTGAERGNARQATAPSSLPNRPSAAGRRQFDLFPPTVPGLWRRPIGRLRCLHLPRLLLLGMCQRKPMRGALDTRRALIATSRSRRSERRIVQRVRRGIPARSGGSRVAAVMEVALQASSRASSSKTGQRTIVSRYVLQPDAHCELCD